MTNIDYAVILFFGYLIVMGVGMLGFLKVANKRGSKRIFIDFETRVSHDTTINDITKIDYFNADGTAIVNGKVVPLIKIDPTK